MRYSGFALAGIALVMATALTSCTSSDDDFDPDTVEPVDNTSVVLRVESAGADPVSYEISCGASAVGNHPSPEEACGVLLDVDLSAFDLVSEEASCTEQYGGDDKAYIVGTIRGQDITTEFNRVNGCEIERWDALVPLLPAPTSSATEEGAPATG